MPNIGLVLSGGGGKGAYEIGVMRFLAETGVDRNIRAVSGTSVGALNAAIFASGNYEKAVHIWECIQQDQILSDRKISQKDVLNWITKVGITQATPQVLSFFATIAFGLSGVALTAIPAFALAVPGVVSAGATIKNVSRLADNSYIFSRDGLIHLIDEGVSFDVLRRSSIPCFVTCLAVSKRISNHHVPVMSKGVEIPWASVKRFDLRGFSDEEIKKLLLASSAIPVVFDSVEFQGRQYFDGGIPKVGDNTPIAPIYEKANELDIKKIIVVRLSSKKHHNHYPEEVICEVKPKDSLGNKLTGTLNFDSEYAKKLIAIGYDDAREQLSPRLDELT